MSDKAFNYLVARIILYLKSQEQKDTSDVLKALFYIRENPNEMKYYDIKDNSLETLEYLTCYEFLCIISSIAFIIQVILLSILNIITGLFSCGSPTSDCWQCFVD